MAVTVDATKGAYIIPALAGSGYVPLAGGTMTGALTIASGTLTASAPALSITQTWNNAAVTFHSAVIDITKTAAVATSTMLDLRIAGVSKVSFEYDASNYPVLRVGTSATSGRITTYQVDCQQILPNEIQLGGYSDTVLRRFSAGKAVMRSGSTQQALLISNFYTDASNYEGLTLTGVAGSSVNITAETLGTGGDNLDIVLTPAGTGVTRTVSPLTIASGTLTASAPALNITQTWNNAAVTFKAVLVNVTKTASDGAGMLQEWQLGGSSRGYIREDGVLYSSGGGYFATVNLGTGSDGNWSAARVGLRSDAYYGIGDSTNANSATQDVRLYRDAAATFAQRNGTTAQTLRVYNTYTDSSNYERGVFDWTSQANVLVIGMQKLGTGSAREVLMVSPYYVSFGSAAGVPQWLFDTGNTAALRPVTTNLYDLGSNSVRVKTGYFGTSVVNAGYAEHAEMTAPSAPATNSVRIYAEDNGSGKTRLMALFATGAAQQIAIEP